MFFMWVNLPTQSFKNAKTPSIMDNLKWSDRSDYHIHFQDSKIVNAESGINGYICFTFEELHRLRRAIDETIRAYDSLGWEESDIKKRNTEIVDTFWEEIRKKSSVEEPKKKRNTQDYLYLIHDTINNTLKIGITANPTNRFRNIQLATSNKLVMLYALKGKAHLEKELHKEFAEIRLASEWFQYDERIIEKYKTLL